MIRFIRAGLVISSLLLASFLGTGLAVAANPHVGGATGQPNVECEDFPTTPGHAAEARGSAFNEDGIGHAAYERAGAPSQYDVACFQQSQHK